MIGDLFDTDNSLPVFSSRTNWNLAPNPLNRLLEEKRKAGATVLDLTESNPTRCGFTYSPALLKALSAEKSLLYEPNPRGLLTAREVVATWYRSHRIRMDADNVILTAGTSEGYGYLFRLLCDPGDTVLVPKPSYPLFDYLCELNDVEARYYRLRYYDEWQVDLDSMRAAVDESTRAILIVHPNNPTGSFVKPQERESIVSFASEHHLALIVDEVFIEFGLQPESETPASFASEQRGIIFTLNGISKTLGLPQMKVAWITTSGGQELVHHAVQRLEVIADTYLTVGTPVQHALAACFDEGKTITDQIGGRVRRNYSELCSMLANTPLSPLHTEAGWNSIVRLPSTESDEAWAQRILRESNVLVYPGHFFEINDETCIVLSLLPQESVFRDGVRRLVQAITSNSSGSI